MSLCVFVVCVVVAFVGRIVSCGIVSPAYKTNNSKIGKKVERTLLPMNPCSSNCFLYSQVGRQLAIVCVRSFFFFILFDLFDFFMSALYISLALICLVWLCRVGRFVRVA